MKNFITLCFFITIALVVCGQQPGIAINIDGSLPDASAMLDVKSTNKGILAPRVSLTSPTDVTTIPAPANSLLVYNTNTNSVQMPDGAGYYYWDVSKWKPLAPATKISAFQPVGCQKLAAVTTTFQKIADMGTFTKASSSTLIEITVQANLSVELFTASSGVVFEVRINDLPTTFGNATALIINQGPTLNNPEFNYPASINGIFANLPSGTCTVSLWAKTTTTGGTATDAFYDRGCFNGKGTNNVLIKEYR